MGENRNEGIDKRARHVPGMWFVTQEAANNYGITG
jgi:hypothetical protein